MAYFDFDRKYIYYNIVGKGLPLLLLHGNCVSSKMFTTEIDYYSKYFKLIYFDYPGLGQSERLSEFRNDFWHYNAQCAFTLLKLLKFDKINIIGTSGGALTGMNLATIAPELINAIVADSFFGEYLSIDEAEKIKNGRTAAKSQLLSIAFWKKMHGDDWSRIVDMDIELMLKTAYNYYNPIEGDLSLIDSYVLLTASTEDELIPNIEFRMNNLAQKLSNCETFYSSIGKHPLMITQKPLFRQLAMDFFNKHPFKNQYL